MEGFVREFLRELNFGQGTDLTRASVNDKYLAMARTVRHYLMVRWLATLRRQYQIQAKSVAYLSAEFLLGRQLDNALLAADLDEVVEEGLASLGIDLAELREAEVEPGLGNGGLGRLAACFIDSLATMNVPCIGYGIRYEYGIFRADVRRRLAGGEARQLAGARLAVGVPAPGVGRHGRLRRAHRAVHRRRRRRPRPAGCRAGASSASPTTTWSRASRTARVNTLRLWSARATRAFDLEIFNAGDYAQAVRATDVRGEHLEGPLPRGLDAAGQGAAPPAAVLLRGVLAARLPRPGPAARLRPAQPARPHHLPAQRHPPRHRDPGADADPRRRARLGVGRGLGHHAEVLRVHVPHPAAGGARGLVGGAPRASCCRATSRSSTGSTRTSWPSCARPTRTTSCACAACRSSPSTPSAACAWPTWRPSPARRSTAWPRCTRSCSRTRSCTTSPTTSRTSSPTSPTASPRDGSCGWRNPGLSELITSAIGDGWVTDLDKLKELEPLADDAGFREAFRQVKRANKLRLVDVLAARDGITVDPDTMLDVHGQAAARVQAADPQAACTWSRCTTRSTSGAVKIEDITPRTVRVRRQGRARLPDGEADHRADQRGRPRREQRPRAARAGSPSRSPPTTTSPSRRSSSPRPTCPSRSRSPARRRPARAT